MSPASGGGHQYYSSHSSPPLKTVMLISWSYLKHHWCSQWTVGGWVDRPVEFDKTYLLHAHLLRHDNNAAIALHSCSQGQSDTSSQEERQTSLTTWLTETRVFTCSNTCSGLPVFPEVGSIIVSPGLRSPARSASSTMRRLILSFTLPPALKYSHLATINP